MRCTTPLLALPPLPRFPSLFSARRTGALLLCHFGQDVPASHSREGIGDPYQSADEPGLSWFSSYVRSETQTYLRGPSSIVLA